MKWQKAARVVVAAIGLGTAAAVYFFTSERPAPAPRPMAADADREATMQSGAGQDERYKGDELVGTLKYLGVLHYEGDRVVWSGFRYRMDDGTVLSADEAEARGTASEGDTPDVFTLKRHVRLERESERLVLEAREGTFSETTGRATIPGPVTITRGRLTGEGMGGEYDRETGVFRLVENAVVTIAPEDDAGEPLEARGASMTFTPDVHAMLFDGQAVLTRSADRLTAERATLYLTEDESNVRLIELRGQAAVVPVQGQTSDLPEMHARDIDLAFYEGQSALERAYLAGGASMRRPSGEAIEGGDIRFRTAPDGTTLTHLEARPEGNGRVTVRMPSSSSVPARTITSRTLVADGTDGKGLTAAVFEGGVQFVETTARRGGQAAERREGRSRRLTLALDGALDAIREARFEDSVEFSSGQIRGFGDTGVYRASAGEIDLRPDAKAVARRARVENPEGGVTVEARELITIFLDSEDLAAVGDVTTASSGKGSKGGSSTSIFTASDPIYGFAAEFRYDDAASRAEYRGAAGAPARLQQGSSIVTAERIEFFRESQDLHANGAVDSTFDIAPSGNTKQSSTMSGARRVLADALVYTERSRTAHYTGRVRLEGRDTGTSRLSTMTADTMDLVLAKDARTLDRLEATGQVHAELDGGRQARGDRLVYDAPDDLYRLWGKPLSILNREPDGTCYAQEGNAARFQGELGAPDFPASENADGGAPRRAVPCPPASAR